MSPKNLLRSKVCRSNLSEFDDVQGHPGFDKQGTRFKRLIKDQNNHLDVEEGIRRLVLCSGKVCDPDWNYCCNVFGFYVNCICKFYLVLQSLYMFYICDLSLFSNMLL